MYSTLKYEQQQNEKFNFLDVKFSIAKNKIETSGYIKPANKSTHANFASHTLQAKKILEVLKYHLGHHWIVTNNIYLFSSVD